MSLVPARSSLSALLCLGVALSTLTSCSAGDAASGDAPPALALTTPGTLLVLSEIHVPPLEYFDSAGNPVGLEYELAVALSQELGLQLEFRDTPFDELIDDLTGGKGDLILSGMTDRAQRQESIDFIDYFVAGSQIIAGADGPALEGVASLCGQTVAVHEGSTNGDLVAAQSALCETAGRAPVIAVEAPNGGSGAAVMDGRAVAGVDDFPVAAQLVADSAGALVIVGRPLEPAPFGIGVHKDRTDVRSAVQAALQHLIADGTYDEILAKYSVSAGSLKTTAINGGA